MRESACQDHVPATPGPWASEVSLELRRDGRTGHRARVAPTILLVMAAACIDTPSPEPVRFAPFQPDLFQSGGALTDAWADVDGDGDPDRFVGFDGAPARLYRNDGIRGFVDVAAQLGLALERPVRSSAWGDYDGDGDPDLLLGYGAGSPVTGLFQNHDSIFVDVAREAGVSLETGVPRQASWVDVDGDGDLDLFLAFRDGPNRLFRNDGPAVGFTDVTEGLGLMRPSRSVGALWIDVDGARLDLVVANMNGDANVLWIGSETGYRAVDDQGLAGGGRAVGPEDQGSVRPCAADVDGDGDFELSFANYGPFGVMDQGPDGRWTDVAPELGLALESRFDTCAWADFDHDGRLDLYLNGTVTGGIQYRDWLLRREGGDRFLDVTPPELLELNADHGATWVDFDGDGDLDLALTGVGSDGMHLLMENLLRPERSWQSLQVRVLDEGGNATLPGAEVRVYATGTDRLLGSRLVDTGSGYDAQSDLPLHFGLAGGQAVDVVVTLPGGPRRRSARIEGVRPAEFQGRVLTVRIGRDGQLHR